MVFSLLYRMGDKMTRDGNDNPIPAERESTNAKIVRKITKIKNVVMLLIIIVYVPSVLTQAAFPASIQLML